MYFTSGIWYPVLRATLQEDCICRNPQSNDRCCRDVYALYIARRADKVSCILRLRFLCLRLTERWYSQLKVLIQQTVGTGTPLPPLTEIRLKKNPHRCELFFCLLYYDFPLVVADCQRPRFWRYPGKKMPRGTYLAAWGVIHPTTWL